MLFQGPESSLKLDIVNYEFPADAGAPDSDDRNWLVLRCTWTENGDVRKDSNSCLLTYELREMTAGLKVVRAGIKSAYESDFVEPLFHPVPPSGGGGRLPGLGEFFPAKYHGRGGHR